MEISDSLLLKNLIDQLHGLKSPLDEEKKPDGDGLEIMRISTDVKPEGVMEKGEKPDDVLASLLGGGDEDCLPGEEDDDEEDDGGHGYELLKRLKG